MPIDHPYHEGELLVQRRLDKLEEGRRNGRAISNTIVKGALPFIQKQPMVIVGSIDPQGDVWASALLGQPGFMTALDQETVEFDLSQAVPSRHDPLWQNVQRETRVGMLFIELPTRRRLRINGRVSWAEPERMRLDVDEAYPNCPKYIQRRHVSVDLSDLPHDVTDVRKGNSLTSAQQEWIRSADTFFVASADPERGLDASHRGGNPGFVRIPDSRRLRIPDYSGNCMFNTLGNFVSYPRGGLLFVDFERPRTLQLVGRPEILWELNDPSHTTGGTKRYWEFEIDHWLQADLAVRPHWEFLDASPHNPS